jgi:hypothetical protein
MTIPQGRRATTAALVVASVLAAVLAAIAAITVLGTAGNQCDNMAGTCLRERQQLAIAAVRIACLAATAAPALAIFLALRGTTRGRRLAAALLLICAAIAIAALVSDPVNHLNNRWGGWLSGDS